MFIFGQINPILSLRSTQVTIVQSTRETGDIYTQLAFILTLLKPTVNTLILVTMSDSKTDCETG